MSLKDKILERSTIAETSVIQNSKIYKEKDLIITDIPAINIALSGRIYGGMGPGLLQIAGETKKFKSKFGLLIADSFMKKFEEGVVLVYDSEWGTPESYYGGMNLGNIVHSPVVDIEQLIHDITVQLDGISVKDNDKLLIILDSLGNLASKKEFDDALKIKKDKNGNVVDAPKDMTRAQRIKSLFRIIGPRIPVKEIYMIVINHTYKTMEMYSTDVVGGGSGTLYNSNIIWIVTSSKNKDSQQDTVGFDFNIKIEKSRFIKQESKIPITVSFDSGIDKWSGLLDLGVDAGYIIRPSKQSYSLASDPNSEYSRKQLIGNDEFFKKLLENTDFPKWVEREFLLL